jgi:uncharacterized protein
MKRVTNSQPFSLLIKPASADCNLHCDYCFYLDKGRLYPNDQRKRMNNGLLEHVIRSYLATDQPIYSFSWQGGEPTLMGLDFFKQAVEYQLRFRQDGARVTNGLQTNGTLLTAEWAKFLVRHQFLVGVSLDGSESIHNRYRTTASGMGSYASVIEGIELLQSNNVEFNILTLVSQANADKPLEVYKFLRDELHCHYHQYIECVEFDSSGGLTDYSITGPQWAAFLCAIFDEWVRHDTNRVSVRLFDSIITTMLSQTPTMCTFGRDCRHYLVVEHNGDVYPCDFYVEEAMKLGNVMLDDWSTLLSTKCYADFGQRKQLFSQTCRTCPFVKLCAGDCQKNRWTKSYKPNSDSVLCDGWKQFYAHSMPTFKKLVKKLEKIQSRNSQNISSPGAIGRNDLCPCGSSRKYKKCCMNN